MKKHYNKPKSFHEFREKLERMIVIQERFGDEHEITEFFNDAYVDYNKTGDIHNWSLREWSKWWLSDITPNTHNFWSLARFDREGKPKPISND